MSDTEYYKWLASAANAAQVPLKEAFEAGQAAAEQRDHGGCTLAGPGRGDCEHFVGLPGKSIPGQHDGPDDTVDCYGKPNGWCWSCWKSHRLENAERDLREARLEFGEMLATAEQRVKEKDQALDDIGKAYGLLHVKCAELERERDEFSKQRDHLIADNLELLKKIDALKAQAVSIPQTHDEDVSKKTGNGDMTEPVAWLADTHASDDPALFFDRYDAEQSGYSFVQPLFITPPNHRAVMEMALTMLELCNKNGWMLADYEQQMYEAIAALKETMK